MADLSKKQGFQLKKKQNPIAQQTESKEKETFQQTNTNVAKKQMSFRHNFTSRDNSKGGNKSGFENVNSQDSINALIYGIEGFKFSKSGKKRHASFFYILESDLNVFQWFSATKKFFESRMKISEIKDMYLRPKSGEVENIDTALFLCLQLEGGREFVMEFDSKKHRDYIWRGLQFMKEYSRDLEILDRAGKKETQIESLLLGTEIDKKKKMNDKEVKRLLRKMLIQIRSDELDERMKKFFKNNEKMLTYSEFIDLVLDLIEKQEIQPLFQKYCINSKMILFREVQKFYEVEQGETFDEKQILTKINKLSKGGDKKIMNPFSFSQLLFTAENTIYEPQKTINQPALDKSLSDYFVNSSFKSYCFYDAIPLQKDPAKAYISQLQKGVRHLDLFCIDGETGEPQVMQGESQTVGLGFTEIIKAIKLVGFERNFTPIILNIEHECSLVQQEKMAETLITILGDILYKLPEEFITFALLPTPNLIKRKILLKTRGKLANIISNFEKRIAKKVKDREEKEKIEREKREKIEEERMKILREQERKQYEMMLKEQELEFELDDDDDEDDPNNMYKGIRLGNESDEEDQKKKKKTQQKKPIAFVSQKIVTKPVNFGNSQTQSSYSNTQTKNKVQSKAVKKKDVKKNNLPPKSSTLSNNPALNLNYPSQSILAINKNEGNEIERLIDLQMTLDKEFINDDSSYSSIKTSQMNIFSIQSNKLLITTNREVKTMVLQQQNSQYSFVDNPKEAMQRKIKTDSQQFQFFEAKSSSLQSVTSNKHSRHQSLKLLPHLEITFKSDVPQFEYHGSNSNLSNKDDLDSPGFPKHQSINEKNRGNGLYKSKHRPSSENVFLASGLNIQNIDISMKEGGQKDYQNDSYDLTQNEKTNKEEFKKSQLMPDETFMPIQNLSGQSPKAYDNSSQRILNQENILIAYNNNNSNNNTMLSSINNQDKAFIQNQIVPKKKNTIPISNSIEKITVLFQCKYNIQNSFSIWSCSQLSDQKVQTMVSNSNSQTEAATTALIKIISHAKKHLIRVYPKQQKTEYSNYNFLEAFLIGCQLVGLNYSTNDIFLLMYIQFFKQNNNSGYVLKPNWLVSDSQQTINQYYEKEVFRPKLWVKVEIISAQSLRVPQDEEKKVNPFIQIKLIGTAIDNASNQNIFTSKGTIQGPSFSSCFNPQYDNFISDFTVHIPELSFIIFQVFDGNEGGNCFAQYAVPVSCIRKGFRVIPLLDQQFNQIPNCFLFAHVTLEVLSQQSSQPKSDPQLVQDDEQVPKNEEKQVKGKSSSPSPMNQKSPNKKGGIKYQNDVKSKQLNQQAPLKK